MRAREGGKEGARRGAKGEGKTKKLRGDEACPRLNIPRSMRAELLLQTRTLKCERRAPAQRGRLREHYINYHATGAR